MQAIQIERYGGEEQLEMSEAPKPSPEPGQVVVRILATSFNPIDPKRTSGVMRQIFPLQFPYTPGGDFSGEIESVGDGVRDFQPGDEVFGYSMQGGSYAEFIAIGADKIAMKPHSARHVEAASLALVAQTALQLLDRAGVEKGKTALIHGAGGAVGSIAVQLAHRRGARVIATGSAQSRDRLIEYGADEVIDYTKSRFEENVKNVDAVLDLVGGDVQARSYRVMKPGAALVATTQPPSAEEAARHGVTASMLITEISTANLQKVAQMADAGEIRPFVGKVYPLGEVAQAWIDYRTNHVEGKIVFLVGASQPPAENSDRPSDKPERIDILGIELQWLLKRSDTSGHYCVLAVTMPPGASVPPHRHPEQEAFFVLEGRIEFALANSANSLDLIYREWRPGDLVNVPGGRVHGFRNSSGDVAKVLLTCEGHLANFFEEAGRPLGESESVVSPPPEAIQRVLEIARKHGQEFPELVGAR